MTIDNGQWTIKGDFTPFGRKILYIKSVSTDLYLKLSIVNCITPPQDGGKIRSLILLIIKEGDENMDKKILYFDCLSGISGDMTIGALLDLGVDKDEFLNELKKIKVDGYKINIKKGQKNGITGTNFNVILESHGDNNHGHNHGHNHDHDNKHHSHDQHHGHHHHRNLHDVEHIIGDSDLNDNVKKLSKEIFTYVAKAEAKTHDKPIEEVHFHEVGAIDSIVDIIGAAICIDKLGVDEIYSSPLHVGTGFVNCAHGKIPVPAPATLDILRGIPVYQKGIRSELVTPTGAAIIKALAKDFIPMPEMVIEKIGYGLGDKDLEITNVLRVNLAKKKLKRI